MLRTPDETQLESGTKYFEGEMEAWLNLVLVNLPAIAWH
jgi:hypothetical protein